MAGLISRARPLALTLCVAAATVVPGTAPVAEPLALADVPLFLATDVPPNLIMAIDDSTSMDSEVLLPTNDGAAWWRRAASGGCLGGDDSTNNSFAGCGADVDSDEAAPGKLNFNYAGAAVSGWKKYVYLFPNNYKGAADTDRRREDDGAHDHYAIPPLPQFAWARSPAYNSLYFNPSVQYKPWKKADGSSHPDSTPNAARFDRMFNPPAHTTSYRSTQTMDLKGYFAGIDNTGNSATACHSESWEVANNYYFRMYKGMSIPIGTCVRTPNDDEWEPVNGGCIVGNGSTCNRQGSDDSVIGDGGSVGIRYFPATFYLKPNDVLPADFGWKAAAPTLVGKAPDGTDLKGYEIKLGNFDTQQKYDVAIQNFANWFTFHRKRHQALRAGLGKAFVDITKMRVAGFRINETEPGPAPDVSMMDIDANRATLYTNFYTDWVGTGGTPNRPAVANIIRNFKRTGAGAPIQRVCQKNFGMLFTDGFSNPAGTFDALGNVDGPPTYAPPFSDAEPGTMADGVMDAYANNLRPDLAAGKVPVPNACNGTNPHASLDCNRNLHMNFYAITLDSRGLQFNPDQPVDPFEHPPTWPEDFPARHPSAVDDLWHSTINGRGLMLNARGADEIAERLGEVLRNIIERTSSASAAAVNSGIISAETHVYQARFNTSDWTGELLSFGLDATGHVKPAADWDAAAKMPAHGDRKIFTINETNAVAPFVRGSLSDVRKQQLTRMNPLPADTAVIDSYVDYIRGKDAAGFRVRPTKLGDIVSSAPLHVGVPRGRYSDNLGVDDAGSETKYSEFVKAQQSRAPMIYVGANDGMLHAINAGNGADAGKEEWAFIPGAVFGNLYELTKTNYAHRYFVDGAPNVGDAFFARPSESAKWHTVLVGGLNKGGRSIYAIDVTSPKAATQTDAAGKFMWEFTDADLGYTYSQPAVVRLHNGQWAAVFGNGYNNTESGSVSGTAVLYVVDIANGTIIRKFDTKVGSTGAPNGMATPVLVDTDGDRIVDHAYAGDLRGNLWKVDLRATDKDDWGFAFGTADAPLPLFTAAIDSVPQPITVRPEVARGPFGAGVMVLFGTGKYIETSDNQVADGEPVQSFYGLVDANTHTDADRIDSRADLRQQTIEQKTFNPGGIKVRTVTDHELTSAQTGWYMNLPTNGELQITDPVVRSDRVIFTTLIPKSEPCSFGGTSWLMEVDLLNGGALPSAPLDTNGDDVVDEKDLLSDADGGGVASGLMADEYLSRPAIVTDPDGDGPDRKIMSGSSGGLPNKAESADHGGRGRQSWRQIR